MKKIIGLVLAGGKSTRMGTNKAYLKIENETLIERSFHLLNELCGEVYISGDYSHLFPSIKDKVGFESRGPIGGIYSSFDYFIRTKISFDFILIVPVDMPKLDDRILQQLLFKLSDIDAFHFDGFEFPLVLKNNTTVISKLNELIVGSPKHCSIKNLLEGLTVSKFKSSTNDYFLNTNFQVEWNNFIKGV